MVLRLPSWVFVTGLRPAEAGWVIFRRGSKARRLPSRLGRLGWGQRELLKANPGGGWVEKGSGVWKRSLGFCRERLHCPNLSLRFRRERLHCPNLSLRFRRERLHCPNLSLRFRRERLHCPNLSLRFRRKRLHCPNLSLRFCRERLHRPNLSLGFRRERLHCPNLSLGFWVGKAVSALAFKGLKGRIPGKGGCLP